MFRFSIALVHRQLTASSLALARTPPIAAIPRRTFQRLFSSSMINFHGHIHKPKPGEELHITFVTKDGKAFTYEVAEGDTIMDIAQAHGLDMEGACGGSCACSTCHVIIDPEYYDAIPEPDDDENDMLDLAFGLTETSRLGCQVKMSKELDGIRVALPSMTRNLQKSDFS
ncbi:adrenodoxin [Ascoidea rubescens DSM 1968]|uniref:Ferredoxin n=1 Tax=Ascoidea rubescens DSM 1968 TaxID=1344418 RepID=A0A1D2VAF0_9ASCO|nr:ferredoxin [Ascoidea rubescens DSM 1968]ODV58634.1 ferredoxin [Ascoidea rubescens DSM 1968]